MSDTWALVRPQLETGLARCTPEASPCSKSLKKALKFQRQYTVMLQYHHIFFLPQSNLSIFSLKFKPHLLLIECRKLYHFIFCRYVQNMKTIWYVSLKANKCNQTPTLSLQITLSTLRSFLMLFSETLSLVHAFSLSTTFKMECC